MGLMLCTVLATVMLSIRQAALPDLARKTSKPVCQNNPRLSHALSLSPLRTHLMERKQARITHYCGENGLGKAEIWDVGILGICGRSYFYHGTVAKH